MAANNFIRKVQMLQMLPSGRKTTTAEIAEKLAAEGFQVDKRTVERDLKSMVGEFGVVCDNNRDQYGWSVESESRLQVKTLGTAEAAAYVIAERVLNDISPKRLIDTMNPMFNAAKKTLSKRRDGFASWPEKIKIIPEQMPLQKKAVSEAVVESVFEGLLQETKLDIAYTKRGAKGPKQYSISPLALVVKGPVFYLVSLDDKDGIIKPFVLHRISQCKLGYENVIRPADFNLDNYVAEKKMNPRYQPTTLKLEAIIDHRIQASINETKISDDQEITERKDGTWLLKATVVHSYDFRRWLFGYVHHIRVLKPKRLVDEVKADLQQAIDNYDITPPAIKSKMRV